MKSLDSNKIQDLKLEFDKEGYIILEDVISNEKCDFFKELLENDYKKYSKFYINSQNNSGHNLENKESEKVVFNLHNKNLAYYELIDNAIIKSFLDISLKEGSYLNSESYLLLNSSARNPNEGSRGQQLHMDSNLPGGDFPLKIIALWMLDDFSPENGATRVVPGSQKFKTYADNNVKYDEEVIINAKKGSVLIFNAALWHGSNDKISSINRWGVILSYGRWFLKPSFDFMQNMPSEIFNKLSDDQKDLLGYKTNPPKDEFTRNSRRSVNFEIPKEYKFPS